MSVKKMVLVPYDMMTQLQYQQTPLISQINSLDAEMEKILADSTLTSDIKHKLYNQILHKHSTFQNEQNKPVKLEVTETQPPRKKNDHFLEEIRRRLPKSKHAVGNRLSKIIANNDSIDWNDKNELVINGKTIPHSNIESLFSYASRDVRREPPRGWDAFANWVIEANVPASAIGNKSGWQYIENIISPIPHMSPLTEDDSPFAKPVYKRPAPQTGSGKIHWSTVY